MSRVIARRPPNAPDSKDRTVQNRRRVLSKYGVEWVPMPRADELTRGDFTRAGAHCLLGWAAVAGGMAPDSIPYEFSAADPIAQAIMCAIRDAIGRDVFRAPHELGCGDDASLSELIGCWNDNNSAAKCAAVFRKAMRSLGYTQERKAT
jgi:hypothetical protein